MTISQPTLVLSKEALASSDEEVVENNVDIVDAMFDGLLHEDEIAPDALRSYYMDFYLTQVEQGGFGQFVMVTDLDEDVLTLLREGLEASGAPEHAALLAKGIAIFEALDEEEQEELKDGEWLGDEDDDEDDNDLEDVSDVDDDPADETFEGSPHFAQLDAELAALNARVNLTELNGKWLRSVEPKEVLEDEAIEAHIEALIAEIPNLDERQAEAEEDARALMSDFELIIRELCEVAGHQLEDITAGDPNYVHQGQKVLGWHFTTDQGEFVMVEEETEAFMLNKETQNIVAAVEFEELDEDDDDDDYDGTDSDDDVDPARTAASQ